MNARRYATLMAEYNAWMNANQYDVCARLSDEDRRADLGTFFGSIHRTMNHLVWADQVFIGRLQDCRTPVGNPDDVLFESFAGLRDERVRLDQEILVWSHSLTDELLDGTMQFRRDSERSVPKYVIKPTTAARSRPC
jgi:uncharacterized damage-inducible protein DinB